MPRHAERWVLAAPIVLFLAACSVESTLLADGTTANWSHWDGRPIAVNYWAEWCAPCRHEIPELNTLHRERSSTGIVVLGVNYDGLTGSDLEVLSKKMKIEFPVLAVDPIGRWNYKRPSVLPTTVIIGPDGGIVEVLVGPQTRESILNVTSKL